LKGLLKGFWWPFRLLKLVKYSQSYGPNKVCDKFSAYKYTLEYVTTHLPGESLENRIRLLEG